MELFDLAFNEAQTLLWDIREMEDMEKDCTADRVEYNALIAYGEMAYDMKGVQL